MKVMHRAVTAVVVITLGVIVLFVGLSLAALRDGGWPWETSISYLDNGPTTVEIIDEGGEAYRFTGSTTDALHWLDRQENELKNAHGFPTKIAVGRVLELVGLALVLVGIVRLCWRLVTVRRWRSTAPPAGEVS